MSGIWGQTIQLSLFGESHGPAVGVVIDGLPSGIALDQALIGAEMRRRAPGQSRLATQRKENDIPEILSGVYQGKTTGTPLCATIQNADTHSGDYEALWDIPRPGHADYPAFFRYGGFQDPRGGGHFSGRLTAPLVFAGAVAKQILAQKGVAIGARIQSIHTIQDAPLGQDMLTAERLQTWRQSAWPLIDRAKETEMRQCIQNAKEQQDSVGGVIQGIVLGAPLGLGDPFFDSVESVLSHFLFSVPAVKGVSFGGGFALSKRYGSECNDAYEMKGTEVTAKTNHNGGVLGGLTFGMPVVFSVAVKPTPSIKKEQQSVSLSKHTEAKLSVQGRHDPCIVPRALPVIEAVTALGMLDLMMRHTMRTGLGGRA